MLEEVRVAVRRYRALERHRGKSLVTNTFFKTHVFDDEETHFAHIL